MTFSQNWEQAYSENKQYSIWPWSSLVSLFYKIYDPNNKIKVLELGCGSGANIKFFQHLDKVDYYGVDGSNTAIKFLKQKFPDMVDNFKVADFSKDLGFSGEFDCIFDRASLTHNNLKSVRNSVKLVLNQLKPEGYYLGIDWFSIKSSYREMGEAAEDGGNTRRSYDQGPFVGIDPVHFFSKDEIFDLFEDFKIIFLQHTNHETFDLDKLRSFEHTGWNFIAKKQ